MYKINRGGKNKMVSRLRRRGSKVIRGEEDIFAKEADDVEEGLAMIEDAFPVLFNKVVSVIGEEEKEELEELYEELLVALRDLRNVWSDFFHYWLY